ncbi:phage tail sheath family protein [Paenibacillus allorhizosphaerae]|uniref:Phage tail sheath family protein n=1 Tax=Paenibacillus allorhizosphaerae TaxID=2849866 RepID=A0ABN7TPT3_9BACL|nr:phage tail sheath family protein [Paenibacillus allorhizosphaerae]CAG7640840.1 hypothetical protein PAECIP111802_02689 [Paenibacillus allorhizosphaerae]
MAEYLSPGVYMEEFDSGGVPMEGASTSTAGFIGLAQRGEVVGLPELVTSFNDFRRAFGTHLSDNAFGNYRFLAYAVEQFFTNGGSRAYIMRVAPSDAKVAGNADAAGSQKPALTVQAKNPGSWGNAIRLKVVPASKAKTQIKALVGDASTTKKYEVKNSAGFIQDDVVVFTDGVNQQYCKVVSAQDNIIELSEALKGEVTDTSIQPVKTLGTCEFNLHVNYGSEEEVYEKCSLNVHTPNHVSKITAKSRLVVISDTSAASDDPVAPFEVIAGDAEATEYVIELAGGGDGSQANVTPDIFIGEDNGAGNRTGIQSFRDNDVVSFIAIPGVTNANVQLELVAHCELLKSRIAILDVAKENTREPDVAAHRNIFDSSYAALYHPWVQVFDPLDKKNIYIPPSGSVAGVYARSDNGRGVHKAPANEIVRGCSGLSVQYNKGEQDIMNPKGINLIRSFPGQGIRVWGARTCSSNGLWKYVNVRRLFIFLEESIKNNTNWVVFEPNDEALWARVHRTIDAFLTRVWRDGALMGNSPEEAYYIQIGRSTMTQDDIDNGRLICVIGVAPVKPAEFVIFRLTQKTGDQ